MGRYFWVLELPSNLRPHLAAALPVVTVALWLQRHRLLSTVAGAATISTFVLLLPYLPTPTGLTPPDGGDVVSISYLNTKFVADRHETMNYLRDREDDIVIYASADANWEREFESNDLGLHVLAGPRHDATVRMLILARDPEAIEVTIHRLTSLPQDAFVELAVTVEDGRTIRVLAVHVISPRNGSRALRREAAFGWLSDWSQARADPVAIIGDLNATPWSPLFETLIDQTELVDTQWTHGLQPSWPARLGPFGLAIDHVLLDSELIAIERRRGPSFGSDHRFIHTSLTLSNPTAQN